MNEYYTKEVKKIEICDVDYMGDYRLNHLFNRFSKVATENAEKLGFWNDEMINRYGWVVAKQSLHLDCPIHLDDEIEILTIPDKGTHVSFPRYYFIKKDGKEIGYCSSIWTLLDMQKRRIVPPKRVGITIPPIENERQLEPPTIDNNEKELNFVQERVVMYSDVDTNQHMNNTRYLEWAFDLIDYDMFQTSFISDIHIAYHKEIQPLQKVFLFLAHDNDHYYIEGRNEENDIYFSLKILFKNR